MFLEDYVWKKVKAVTFDGREYTGLADMYCSAGESGCDEPVIAILTDSGESVRLCHSEIKSIEETDRTG